MFYIDSYDHHRWDFKLMKEVFHGGRLRDSRCFNEERRYLRLRT
jgi:hypothetical protein